VTTRDAWHKQGPPASQSTCLVPCPDNSSYSTLLPWICSLFICSTKFQYASRIVLLLHLDILQAILRIDTLATHAATLAATLAMHVTTQVETNILIGSEPRRGTREYVEDSESPGFLIHLLA
jgi:hypothetical protein